MQGFQFFSPEEAEVILRRAAGSELTSEQVTEDQLVSMAAELGISPEAVRSAALRHREESELAQLTEQYRGHLKKKILDDVGAWAGTSVLLIVIDLLITRQGLREFALTWSVWPVGIWGASLAVETIGRLRNIQMPDREQVLKWKAKRDKKALKRSKADESDQDDE